jgi:hypothetical protein
MLHTRGRGVRLPFTPNSATLQQPVIGQSTAQPPPIPTQPLRIWPPPPPIRIHPYNQSHSSRPIYTYHPNAGSMTPLQNQQTSARHASSSTQRTTLWPPSMSSVPVDPPTTNPVHVSSSRHQTSPWPPWLLREPVHPPAPVHLPMSEPAEVVVVPTYDRCYYCYQKFQSCQRTDQDGYRILDYKNHESCKYCKRQGLKCREMNEYEMATRCLPCRDGRVSAVKCSDVDDRPCPRCVKNRLACQPYVPRVHGHLGYMNPKHKATVVGRWEGET